MNIALAYTDASRLLWEVFTKATQAGEASLVTRRTEKTADRVGGIHPEVLQPATWEELGLEDVTPRPSTQGEGGTQ